VRGLADSQTFPVALDARRILPVPAGRLKAWLLPLLEFLDEDRPRLSRHNAVVLAGLEQQPAQWTGGEELRALGRRLNDFSGLTHHAPAPGFAATLRPYQQIGLDWLQFLREYGLAGILADDMGLGKTVQTLAHLHLEKASGRADRPSLVVATTSLMANWRDEAAQFTPELNVLILHGKDRAERFGEIAAADLVLTTYPLLVRDRETLLAQDWHLLVMDEAQFIKNPKAQSHQVARSLRARHRLSLTGTPLENHLGELWAQFDFLMPGLLGNAKRFTQVFRTPIEKLGDEEMRVAPRGAGAALPAAADQGAGAEGPAAADRDGALGRNRGRPARPLRIPARGLRPQVAPGADRAGHRPQPDHDFRCAAETPADLLRSAPGQAAGGRSAGEKGPRPFGQAGHVDGNARGIARRRPQGAAVLAIHLDAGADRARARKTRHPLRQTHRPDPRPRNAIADFQEGRVPLFLISLKAGGTGLNLTAADTVIHYDPWWNPAVEEQATARAHRIGQDKPVFVYKLMTQGTVEEKILALQGRKRGLADQLLKQGGAGGEGGGHLLTAGDLDVLFQPLG
jgi:hypothetical protein